MTMREQEAYLTRAGWVKHQDGLWTHPEIEGSFRIREAMTTEIARDPATWWQRDK